MTVLTTTARDVTQHSASSEWADPESPEIHQMPSRRSSHAKKGSQFWHRVFLTTSGFSELMRNSDAWLATARSPKLKTPRGSFNSCANSYIQETTQKAFSDPIETHPSSRPSARLVDRASIAYRPRNHVTHFPSRKAIAPHRHRHDHIRPSRSPLVVEAT
jgi:hypothetical protein